MNATKGGARFGHAAVLIGNDDKGWRLYSKNGTAWGWKISGPTGGDKISDKGGYFRTLEDFASVNFEKDGEVMYDRAYRFVSEDMDEDMEKAALKEIDSWYDITGILCGIVGGSCIDMVNAALRKGHFETGETMLRDVSPNSQYERIEYRNKNRIGWDETKRINPQKRQEEEKRKLLEKLSRIILERWEIAKKEQERLLPPPEK